VKHENNHSELYRCPRTVSSEKKGSMYLGKCGNLNFKEKKSYRNKRKSRHPKLDQSELSTIKTRRFRILLRYLFFCCLAYVSYRKNYFSHFEVSFAVGTCLFSMRKQFWDRLYIFLPRKPKNIGATLFKMTQNN
jgi:hypothetical protein